MEEKLIIESLNCIQKTKKIKSKNREEINIKKKAEQEMRENKINEESAFYDHLENNIDNIKKLIIENLKQISFESKINEIIDNVIKSYGFYIHCKCENDFGDQSGYVEWMTKDELTNLINYKEISIYDDYHSEIERILCGIYTGNSVATYLSGNGLMYDTLWDMFIEEFDDLIYKSKLKIIEDNKSEIVGKFHFIYTSFDTEHIFEALEFVDDDFEWKGRFSAWELIPKYNLDEKVEIDWEEIKMYLPD